MLAVQYLPLTGKPTQILEIDDAPHSRVSSSVENRTTIITLTVDYETPGTGRMAVISKQDATLCRVNLMRRPLAFTNPCLPNHCLTESIAFLNP